MQVEAIYNQGKIELSQPLRLKHNNVRLVVTVPDDEIEVQGDTYNLPPEVVSMAKEMQDKLEAIRNAPPIPDEMLPPLSQKQLDRIEAFSVRDEIRSMR